MATMEIAATWNLRYARPSYIGPSSDIAPTLPTEDRLGLISNMAGNDRALLLGWAF